jgi:hypothetical protein
MQKSIFKQGERFHAGYDNHFDHCRRRPKLAAEASPEPASSPLVVTCARLGLNARYHQDRAIREPN